MKIFFYKAVSLDGYLADENTGRQGLFGNPSGETSTYDAFIAEADTVIMGRKHTKKQKMIGEELFYPGKANFIFSHTESGEAAAGF